MSSSRRSFVKKAALAAGLAAAGPLGPRSAHAAGMSVSWAKREITPGVNGAPANPFLAGYGCSCLPGGPHRVATGTRTPLFARCLVFWDAGSPNVIATADVLGFPPRMHLAIRERVMGAATRPHASSDFVLAASHTHNGPVLQDVLDPYIAYGMVSLAQVDAYSDWLVAAMADVVREALEATVRPCTLDFKVQSETFSHNRERLGYVETAVPVLTARAQGSGAPLAVLFSYGCHPVAAGEGTLFDADFPGHAMDAVESAGVFPLFLTGAAGDQDPVGARGWALAEAHGAHLGALVKNDLPSPGRDVTGPILTDLRWADLPLDITDTPHNLAAVRALYQNRLDALGLADFGGRHAQVMMGQIDAHSFETSIRVPFQTWKLQGTPTLRLALCGGELVSGYAALYRNRYGADNVLVAGYVNEVSAYVPSDELLPPLRSGGSYAGGWGSDAPGIAGGSLTVYPALGHFRAGPGGVEEVVVATLDAMLA
jgi:hypothetical protein